jgi:hypothetical protein
VKEKLLRVLENLLWRIVKPMLFATLDELIEAFDEEIITSGSQAADKVREYKTALEGFETWEEEIDPDEADARRMLTAVGLHGDELDRAVNVVARSARLAGVRVYDVVTVTAKTFATGRMTSETFWWLVQRNILSLGELARYLDIPIGLTQDVVRQGRFDSSMFLSILTIAADSRARR